MRRDVRAVNGYGPKCGCGNRSALHIEEVGAGAQVDIYLCVFCTFAAATNYVANLGQEPFGPDASGPVTTPGRRLNSDA